MVIIIECIITISIPLQPPPFFPPPTTNAFYNGPGQPFQQPAHLRREASDIFLSLYHIFDFCYYFFHTTGQCDWHAVNLLLLAEIWNIPDQMAKREWKMMQIANFKVKYVPAFRSPQLPHSSLNRLLHMRPSDSCLRPRNRRPSSDRRLTLVSDFVPQIGIKPRLGEHFLPSRTEG